MFLKKNLKGNSRFDFVIKNNILLKSKRSQIWVETAIYTLIGLAIIAIILTTATPQIEKIKDKAIVEQTISAMNVLDNKISEVEQSAENIRIIDFKIAKGRLEINSANDSIKYILEGTKLELSEPGEEIKQGNIVLKTEKKFSKFEISLTMKYDNLNLTYNNKDEMKILQAGATPYKIVVENKGVNRTEAEAKTQIDFSVI